MSYGTNAPQGLVPSLHISGATWSGQVEPYAIASGYANNIYVGTPVKLNTDGTIIPISSTTDPILGVFMGCFFQAQNAAGPGIPIGLSPYWPGGTVTINGMAAEAKVITDPTVVYDIQCNTTILQTTIGNNLGIASPGTGSTATGNSTAVLDSATGALGSTANVKVVGLSLVPGNTFGLQYNNAFVIINNNVEFSPGTASV